MINLKNNENQKISLATVTRILFYTLPLAFILGNLVLSLQIVLFIIFALLLIKRENLRYRFHQTYWILIIFFSYLFLSTSFQYLSPGLLNDRIADWSLEENPIFKSFMLVRFLLLIFVIDTLFFNKILNLKKLFLSSLIFTSFVTFDVILQNITGTDIFGYKNFHKWSSGPFGDEMIAGSYLEKFSFFSFFYFFTIKEKKYASFFIVFIIVFHLIATLLSGNRMPLVLFLFGCGLIFLFVKNFRILMSISLLIFFTVFLFLNINDTKIKHAYSNFFTAINIFNLFEKEKNNEEKNQVESSSLNKIDKKIKLKENLEGIILLDNTGYNRIWRTSIVAWKEKPLLGSGLKSFRIKCWKILSEDYLTIKLHPTANEQQKLACANHSHNYYFEILVEAGLIGLLLIVLFFIILFKEFFNILKNYNRTLNKEVLIIIPIIVSIFLEIWPIRSAGSFFTTWNATFFWLCIGLFFAKKNQS